MLFFALDCGRQVWLDGFDYSRTYAGLLEGRPNAELNARILEDAVTRREAVWGKRPIHLISPVIDNSDTDHPVLPPVLLRAWLVCSEPVNPEFMGSELVVVWFCDECHGESIEEFVLRAVRTLPWDQLAGDFDW